jgi:hypothetical protein
LWKYYRDFLDLDKQEQDFFLYGKLNEIWYRPGTFGNRQDRVNKKDLFDYNFYGVSVCQGFFAAMHGGHAKDYIKKRQTNLIEGTLEKVDKRGGCHHSVPLEERKTICGMIKAHIDGISFPDPASEFTLLPRDFTIMNLYNEYKKQRQHFGLEVERSYEYIRQLFREQFPYTRKAKNYSDYCGTCAKLKQ